MKFAKALIIGAVLSAGAAFAEEKRTDPNAIARGELMTLSLIHISEPTRPY